MSGNPQCAIFVLLLVALSSLTSSCGGLASFNPGLSGAEQPSAIGEQLSFPIEDQPDRQSQGLGDIDHFAWFAEWIKRHLSVQHGENHFDLANYYAGSSGVYSYAIGRKPRIILPPAPAEGMSHVQFGVRNVPAGEIMRRIQATLHVDARDDEDAEFLVGYSNYETDRFQWSGPFTAADDISLVNWWVNNVNASQRGYLVIGVRGNTYPAEIWHASVNIGPPGPTELP
jgi:hypothetical protein